MCPCRICYFWQDWGHWACAHAEFITFGCTAALRVCPCRIIAFGRTEGIERVPMQNVLLLAEELKALGVCPCRIYCFRQNWGHWACAHAEFVTFGRTEGIGRVPMQNILLLAELGALGVCPCRIYCFWQNWGHWACAHAEFIAFGRTEGIGRVPMWNVSAGTQGKAGGGAWGRREQRDGRCARRGVATSSPAWPAQPYPVRPVESAPGIQTPDTRHLSVYIMHRLSLKCL